MIEDKALSQTNPIFAEPWYLETLAIARELHVGQTDAAGGLKADHVERAAHNLVAMFPDASRAEVQAALLHDTIEDTDATWDSLAQRGIPHIVLDVVSFLTHDKEGIPYLDYVRSIVEMGGISATRVKLADNMDNLSRDRPDYPGRAKREQEKYLPARRILREGLGLPDEEAP